MKICNFHTCSSHPLYLDAYIHSYQIGTSDSFLSKLIYKHLLILGYFPLSLKGEKNNMCSFIYGSGGFQFCEDDTEVETILRSAFGGSRTFYWSFINEEIPQWGSSSGYRNNYRSSWNWRDRMDEEYGYSTDSDSSESDLASHRMALGLSVSGPLKLEEVKNAWVLLGFPSPTSSLLCK